MSTCVHFNSTSPYIFVIVTMSMCFFFFTLLLFSFSCFMISLSTALNNGFSVELIHRDSSKSPLYQPTQNKYQRVSMPCIVPLIVSIISTNIPLLTNLNPL
ncbi:hypothetical protein MtrunA17_Chr4g0002271 [Medicago truncatula]|uniref:Transmembrane protein n=1 Tax=Medicago truncatula TaxID=3880 RepID=A0A396I2K4_MEDTR|nr:hypothetical protein MtrunA17_Chr4g0002271 [Medicago truncatula]